MHADGAVERGGATEGLGNRPVTGAQLDERQQVHRVERMANGEPPRMLHLGLQQGRPQARGRGAEHDVRTSRGARGSQETLLDLEALGSRLLDELGVKRRLLGGGHERDRAFAREGQHGQLAVGAAGVIEQPADVLGRRGVWVVHLDVDPVQREAGSPTAADDPGP